MRRIRYAVAGTLAVLAVLVGYQCNLWFGMAIGTAAIAALTLYADPGAP